MSHVKLFDKAVIIRISLTSFGLSRRLNPELLGVDSRVSPRMLRLNKILLESDLLVQISELDGEIRRFVASQCLLSNLFKGGAYLCPLGLVSSVDESLRDYYRKRNRLVEELVSQYDNLKERVKVKLGPLYNADDYPSKAVFHYSYSMKWYYMEIEAPHRFLNNDFIKRFDEAIREEIESVRLGLREAFSSLVSHLTDRLGSKPDGSRKKFKDATIDNLVEFISLFKHKNITDDNDLESLVSKAESILSGIDPETLRSSDNTRNILCRQFKKLQGKLDSLIESVPSRKITIE